MHAKPLHVASLLLAAAIPAQTVVFQSDFNGVMPPEVVPGKAKLEGVQGYAGYGPVSSKFGQNFLRSETANEVQVQLTGLPAHDSVSLDFLFAAIDSLDGTGTFPAGDYFRIRIDGNTIFRESFANALPSQIQSYVPPAGVQLARRLDLGFSGPGGYYTDSAYWMGGDVQFQGIGHTGSTLTLSFIMEGAGAQSLADESWALDNLRISVATIGKPGSAKTYGTGCGPELVATAVPYIGRPLPLLVTNLPASRLAAWCALGMSDSLWGTTPLPLKLDVYGMPGCWLLQDLLVGTAVPLTLSNTAATGTIPVPNTSGLAGLRCYLQTWTVAPGTNQLGVLFSNGLKVEIGG